MITDLGGAVLFGTQVACFSGFSALYLGKVFSSIDPLKAAGAASRTAGMSTAIGVLAGEIFGRWSQDSRYTRYNGLPALFVVGTVTMLSCHVYEKAFPLIGTISFTALGAFAAVGCWIGGMWWMAGTNIWN